jgi:hypothetical protein
VRGNQVGYLEKSDIITCLSGVFGIVSVPRAAKQDVQRLPLRWFRAPLDFSRRSFEVSEDAFAYRLGRELTLASDESVIGEAENIQLVFFEPPLADILELPVDETWKCLLAKSFEQRAHIVRQVRDHVFIIRVVAEQAKLVLVAVDKPGPEPKQRCGDAIPTAFRSRW